MSVISKFYFALFILVFAFLAYQCGDNKKNTEPEVTTNSGQTANNETALQKGDAVAGKTYFDQTCSACHGMDAKGLPKLGKDLTTSKYVAEKTDKELLTFIDQGRLATDPLNTTGVAMPPKGGNPAFNDQQIMDIIAYVRQLHQ